MTSAARFRYIVGMCFLKKTVLPVAFTAAVLLLVGCAPKIEEDFVIFDQAYVTAVVTTSQRNPVLSRQALENLMLTWQDFKPRWYGAGGTDTAWRTDFDTVERLITRADSAAMAGSTAASFRVLDKIPPVFCGLRRRNGIEYFIDYLTAFKKELTVLNGIAAHKTPATLEVSDMLALRKAWDRADAAWERVTSAPFDKDLFHFCKLNVAYLKNNITRVRASLNSLDRALDEQHKFNVIRYLNQTAGSYNRLFIVFGNFGCLNPGT